MESKRHYEQLRHEEEDDEETMHDQREREQLERNMRERDTAKARKLAEKKLTRKECRSSTLERIDIDKFRKLWREEYVKIREQEKVQELRDEIEDNRYLFDGVKLTEAENRELRHKEKIYELVMKRSEGNDYTDEYRMPEAYDQEGGVNQEKRFAVAVQRYKDPGVGNKLSLSAEQDSWEVGQLGKATLNFGDHARMNFYAGNIGDHLALLNADTSWKETNYSSQWCCENYINVKRIKQAGDIRDQLVGLLERVEIKLTGNPNNLDAMRKSIITGLFPHCGSYRPLKHPQTVSIHPSSGLAQILPRCVVYHELVLTTKEYMRQVTEVEQEWLVEIAPRYFTSIMLKPAGK